MSTGYVFVRYKDGYETGTNGLVLTYFPRRTSPFLVLFCGDLHKVSHQRVERLKSFSSSLPLFSP